MMLISHDVLTKESPLYPNITVHEVTICQDETLKFWTVDNYI